MQPHAVDHDHFRTGRLTSSVACSAAGWQASGSPSEGVELFWNLDPMAPKATLLRSGPQEQLASGLALGDVMPGR